MPDQKDTSSNPKNKAQPDVTRDTLRHVATFLYGAEWREGTALALQTDRRSFVRELASDEPISQEIWLTLSRITEERLERVWREHTEILEAIREHLHQNASSDQVTANPRRTALPGRSIKSRTSES